MSYKKNKLIPVLCGIIFKIKNKNFLYEYSSLYFFENVYLFILILIHVTIFLFQFWPFRSYPCS